MRLAVILAMAVVLAGPHWVFAETTEERLERLERRLNTMDHQYQEQLKERDAQIARLREELQATRAAGATTQAATQAELGKARQAEIDELTQEIIGDIQKREAKTMPARIAANFNPDIAVVADFVGNLSDRHIDGTRNRMDVREVELDLRAAVDPRADAVVVLAFARDANIPLFPGEEFSGPENSVEAEEAYLFFHDFGVDNLTAKVGRYHLRFGRQNILHLHDLPTTDTPFVLQSFLAPEALSDAGLSLSYVVPNPWNEYIEVIGEINSGEGVSSESPTLRGDLNTPSPSFNTHVLWNKDLARNWNLEIGGSALFAHSDNENNHQVVLLGHDVTLIRRDPTGGFFNQMLQFEAIHGITDNPDNQRMRSSGAYLLGQQQLSKDWYAGMRLDWTQDANDNTRSTWGAAPYVSWYWSEFLRFRLEYEHRGGDVPDEDLLFFQLTWIFGAHPPHPYWAMR